MEQIPLLVGVTGHRDLVPAELESLRAAVQAFLAKLQRQFPDAPLLVATSLSQGADLLVAEQAMSLGIDCCAVLPLPPALYRKDFDTPDYWRRFEAVLARCSRTILCFGEETAAASLDAPVDPNFRAARYAAAGEHIASQAFILLALWDGRPARLAGGTASTVEFRLSRRAGPDLVYQIVISRQSGAPLAGLVPLQQGYRAAIDGPFESEMPARAVIAAAQISESNRELRRRRGRS